MAKKKNMGMLALILFWIVNLILIAYTITPIDLISWSGVDDGIVGFYVFNRIKEQYF